MPETDPILIAVEVDNLDAVAGLKQTKAALDDMGTSAEKTAGKIDHKLVPATGSLLRTILHSRVAIGLAKDELEAFGVKSDIVSGAVSVMTHAMNLAIIALNVYSVASYIATSAAYAKAAAMFIAAKAAFLEAIANVSAATLFTATLVAVGLAIGAWAAINAMNAPKAQHGGIIPARVGGTSVIAGEAGRSEAIVPLGQSGAFGGGDVYVTVNSYAADARELVRDIGREIQMQRAMGA